jgi:hypothetical protein
VRTRTTTIIIGITAAAGLLCLTACDPSTSHTATGTETNPSSTVGATGTSAAAPPAKPKTATVPDLVGKGLQTAQDTAQAAGFYNLTSHDSLGRDRMQVLDRDWQVCTQTPAAGTTAPVDTKLDFGAVKLTEKCPAGGDQKPPAKAGSTMPNYVGKGLAAARSSLPSRASITTTDATGDRMILLESNWKICTQDPKAGAPYTGQPVTFTAVKTGETCP